MTPEVQTPETTTPETANSNSNVTAPAKVRGKYAKKTGDATTQVITFTFTDGEVVIIDTKNFPEPVRILAMLHGFSQKLGDAYASAKSVGEAKGLFNKVLDTLNTTGWTGKREGTGVSVESTEILINAVYMALSSPEPLGYGKTVELDAVKGKVEGSDAAARRAYRNDPKVAYHLAQLKAKASDITAVFGL